MEFLSIAVDAQGPDLPSRYTTKASTTFTTVVDAENRVGQALGCKAIPNAVFVDEQGTVRYIKRGGFDIHKPEHLALAESWATSPSLDELSTLSEAEAEKVIKHPEALEHFRRGLALYQDGKTDEAMAAWREGVAIEPDNFNIRKQIWAVEHPDKFYDDKVDYAWQREQMEKGQ